MIGRKHSLRARRGERGEGEKGRGGECDTVGQVVIAELQRRARGRNVAKDYRGGGDKRGGGRKQNPTCLRFSHTRYMHGDRAYVRA